MADSLLSIKNLTACIGEKTILHDISLSVDRGETHVLMGPNGAGKSTLGYTLMGNPDYTVRQGSIVFDGADITAKEADERAKAGLFLSFQDPLEVPGLTLESFVRSSLQQVSGARVKLVSFKKELEEAMDILHMDHAYAARDLNVGFSGGEKKKSEILQLFMLKPSLAILDETDSGLDVDAVRTVSQCIREYQTRMNGALLVITHSTRILESLHVDHTHVMVKGRIVHSGGASVVQEVNEHGFDPFIPQEIKDAERRERLAAAAKAAMDAVKSASGTEA
ncbi:MAG: Fe-S cluster assembly ATPase SufC [Treponema sp.]|nr:Fe-S cluster assembly ATPase SufC [Treponema sp.]